MRTPSPASSGDSITLYGAGATCTQVDSTLWRVSNAAGSLQETITFNNGATANAQHVVFV